jgi:hypothetical protein
MCQMASLPRICRQCPAAAAAAGKVLVKRLHVLGCGRPQGLTTGRSKLLPMPAASGGKGRMCQLASLPRICSQCSSSSSRSSSRKDR